MSETLNTALGFIQKQEKLGYAAELKKFGIVDDGKESRRVGIVEVTAPGIKRGRWRQIAVVEGGSVNIYNASQNKGERHRQSK